MTATPRPRVGDQRVQQRVEWGVRFRVSGEAHVDAYDDQATAVSWLPYYRTQLDTKAAVVSRVVEVHPWREVQP